MERRKEKCSRKETFYCVYKLTVKSKIYTENTYTTLQ